MVLLVLLVLLLRALLVGAGSCSCCKGSAGSSTAFVLRLVALRLLSGGVALLGLSLDPLQRVLDLWRDCNLQNDVLIVGFMLATPLHP